MNLPGSIKTAKNLYYRRVCGNSLRTACKRQLAKLTGHNGLIEAVSGYKAIAPKPFHAKPVAEAAAVSGDLWIFKSGK